MRPVRASCGKQGFRLDGCENCFHLFWKLFIKFILNLKGSDLIQKKISNKNTTWCDLISSHFSKITWKKVVIFERLRFLYCL